MQHKELLKRFFDREKARMIMIKLPKNNPGMSDIQQGIQQKVSSNVRDQVIDHYYTSMRKTFHLRYKSWVQTMGHERIK